MPHLRDHPGRTRRTQRRGMTAAAALLLLVGGCSYDAHVPARPASDIISNYDTPVNGRFALYVDSDAMRHTINPTGYDCSAAEYPTDGRSSFRNAVIQTMERVVASVEVVDEPLAREDLIARNLTGMIRVEAEDMDTALNFIPGFFSSNMEADVEVAASLTVDGREGRVLGSTFRGDGTAIADVGFACEGGADAISRAAGKAMEELLRTMGEQLSNAPRVRALEGDGPADAGETPGT